MSRLALRLLVTFVILTTVVPAARADRSDARNKVRQAQGMLQNPTPEQLERAEARIREAIVLYDKPFRGNLLRGGDYFPYFHLGRVLEMRGRCRDALSAWQASLEHDAVRGDEREELLRRQAGCQERVKTVEAARDRVAETLERGAVLRSAVERLARQKVLRPIWSTGSPSFAARQRTAVDALETAGAAVRAADQALDAAAIGAAETRARAAVGQLEAIERDAKTRRAELDRVRSEALEALEAIETRTERTLRWAARLAPYPPNVQTAVTAIEDLKQTIDGRRDEAEPEELERLRRDLDVARGRLAARVAAPPKPLVDAAEAYLGGEYQEAVSGLLVALGRVAAPDGEAVDATLDKPRAVYHALTLIAASRHALWSLGGERDDLLLSQVEEVVREAAVLDVPPSTQIGEQFFTPGFRALVDRVTTEVENLGVGDDAADESAADEPASGT
ncbi:MAG: hypothetical protein AAGE94_13125 [Acidobacteriota bacterium]